MALDNDLFDEYLKTLADHYTPTELIEELGVSVWDVIEAFRDQLQERPIDVERYR